MNSNPEHPHQVDEQAELLTGLLEGEEPGAYVVITAAALSTQVLIAIRETTDRDGRVKPGKTTARLLRSLATLGFITNTRNQDGTHMERTQS